MSGNKVYRVKVERLKVAKSFVNIFASNQNNRKLDALEEIYRSDSPLRTPVEGEMCIAKVGPQYLRCRLINRTDNSKAKVSLVDTDVICEVPFKQIKVLNNDELRTMKPLGKMFVLAGFKVQTQTSEDGTKLDKLKHLLVGNYFLMSVIFSNKAGTYVQLQTPDGLKLKDIVQQDPSFSSFVMLVGINEQMKEMEKAFVEWERGFNDHQNCRLTELAAVASPRTKSSLTTLSKQTEHLVVITSFDQDSNPFSFSVEYHLQHYKNKLAPFEYTPSFGTKCLIVHENRVRRASVVSTRTRSSFTVRLDNCHTELNVDLRNLLQIPRELEEIAKLPITFTLSDYQKDSATKDQQDELNFYFKFVASQKILTLKPSATKSVLPSCQLFDGKLNVLEACKQVGKTKHRYSIQGLLNMNEEYEIVVCSVESPRDFSVHLTKTTEHHKYVKLSESLQRVNPPMLENPKQGDACIVKMDGINRRARIVKSLTDEIFKVEFVDIGFFEDVHVNDVKATADLIAMLPPAAFKCCLQSFASTQKLKPQIIQEFIEVINKANERIMKMRTISWDVCFGSYIVYLRDSTSEQSLAIRPPVFNNTTDWSFASCADGNSNKPQQNVSLWTIDDGDLSECAFSVSEEDEWEDYDHIQYDVVRRSVEADAGTKVRADAKSQTSEASSSGFSSGCQSEEALKSKEVCRITALVSPTDFTIQRSDRDIEFKEFCRQLQKAATHSKPSIEFANGTHCLAYHNMTDMWTRAIIIDVDDETDFLVTVKDIDSGSTFSIDDIRNLKELPDQFTSISSFGVRCSLPVACQQEAEATKLLMSLLGNDLTVRTITDFRGKKFIELYHENRNIAESLVESQSAKRIVVSPSGPAYIVYVKHTEQFSIQMESDSAKLDEILNYTCDYNRIEVENPKIGMLVLGFFCDRWYRSTITAISPAKTFNVYFIDYGHHGYVKEIGAIENVKIKEIEPISYECSLEIPPNMKPKPTNVEKLKSAADNGHCKVFVMLKRPEVNAAIVDVFTDEHYTKNINASMEFVDPTAEDYGDKNDFQDEM